LLHTGYGAVYRVGADGTLVEYTRGDDPWSGGLDDNYPYPEARTQGFLDALVQSIKGSESTVGRIDILCDLALTYEEDQSLFQELHDSGRFLPITLAMVLERLRDEFAGNDDVNIFVYSNMGLFSAEPRRIRSRLVMWMDNPDEGKQVFYMPLMQLRGDDDYDRQYWLDHAHLVLLGAGHD